MTHDEVFQKVKTHLLTQGKKSADDLGMCTYRAEGGLSCAVGCLITDEAYSKSLETKGVKTEAVQNALIASGIDMDGDMVKMLDELQIIHDHFPPRRWAELLDQNLDAYQLLTLSGA